MDPLVIAIAGVAFAGVVYLLVQRRGRAAEESAEFRDVRATVEEDLVALGEALGALNVGVEGPGAEAARDDYARALDYYDRASRALERARVPDDIGRVTAAIDEARFSIARAEARLEGRPLPERRPLCFFDPRHGPSTRDVEWTPAAGAPRLVPACEADALRIEEGREPASREVLVGDRFVPYWQAPAFYGPWAGGFFAGFGGLLPGLLIGTALGSHLGSEEGGSEGDSGDDSGDGEGDSGEGGSGEGDFAGEDYTSGDFGGGDFGGGDFGGADF